jgi:CBS domain-containing protein
MATTIREAMTPKPITLKDSATAMEAARAMRDSNIGDIIVYKDDHLCGIVTDRDIVIRVLAEGKDPSKTKLESICSKEVTTLSPLQTTDDAVKLMRQKAIRRIPVVEDGKAVGIVSIGDLAIRLDRRSALADVTAAQPNR